MKNSEVINLVPGIDWVGILDFGIVTFDVVMETKYGTTYNSYVVKGTEKTALIETAKATFFDEYIEKVKSVVDPAQIDYIVLDHTEPDHSGSLARLLTLCPKAKVIASAAALKYLKDITNEEFPCQAVREGDSLDLGGKTLQFIGASNLHWPDSIYTYVPEDKVLFTCDSFGAHFASPSKKIFDDEVGDYRDAFDYYFAAILRPFSRFFLRAIEKVEAMEIKMICPGHGPVLRSHWKECVAHSKAMCEEFVKLPQKDMVLVAYVSAYGYTKALAEKIAEGIRSEGLQVDLCDVEKLGVGEIGAHAEKASGLIFGSPTINQNALPPLYNCFAALSPLRDRGKLAGGFGSYGWSGEAKEVIEANIKASKLDFVGDTYFVKFKPSEAELQGAVEYGVRFASKLK
ncbi:MAG: FprA family A-type flavoprotein [Bacteroidetes bacterium]|uniref:FprA family A-type flavoprotein n=1 Tax=Candidatus Pullibacteroides excrementavium TaxID=2840905 RepID=A0A9D9H176_9BACT|nr:FprA family A-type flavoprotein [Candidatus Pullibacteroides excrementavium]